MDSPAAFAASETKSNCAAHMDTNVTSLGALENLILCRWGNGIYTCGFTLPTPGGLSIYLRDLCAANS